MLKLILKETAGNLSNAPAEYLQNLWSNKLGSFFQNQTPKTPLRSRQIELARGGSGAVKSLLPNISCVSSASLSEALKRLYRKQIKIKSEFECLSAWAVNDRTWRRINELAYTTLQSTAQRKTGWAWLPGDVSMTLEAVNGQVTK